MCEHPSTHPPTAERRMNLRAQTKLEKFVPELVGHHPASLPVWFSDMRKDAADRKSASDVCARLCLLFFFSLNV